MPKVSGILFIKNDALMDLIPNSILILKSEAINSRLQYINTYYDCLILRHFSEELIQN